MRGIAMAILEAENAGLKAQWETRANLSERVADTESRLADAEAALRIVLAYLAYRQHPGPIAPVVNAARAYFAKYAAQPNDKESGG